MKKYISLLLILAFAGIWHACKQDFLDIKPASNLDKDALASKDGVEALLIGSYHLLHGQPFGWGAATTNWVYGSIRGMESNKGTDAGDQPNINPIQTFSETATNGYLNDKWREVYEAVTRCNNTIVVANIALKKGTITQDQADLFIQQARALRGWYHFEAWRMWEKVPYLDETVVNPLVIANAEDIRPKIIADLTEGLKLPTNMKQVGRFNKTVCQILLAKAIMQMNHDYAGAKLLLLDAQATGTKPDGAAFGLAPTFGEIFDIANRNGIESIYTVQYSVNDGSGGQNGGNGEVLNFPYKSGGSPGGCCGFFDPTQEFVNSFRTAGGLPLLDNTYDTPLNMVKNDQGVPRTSVWDIKTEYVKDAVVTILDPNNHHQTFYKSLIGVEKTAVPINVGNNPVTSPAAWLLSSTWDEDAGPLDPRLDWSVGRKGIPYWDWGIHTGADWIRDQTYSGPYSPKKQVYKKSQEGQFTEVGSWTSGYTANGYRMIRYADLLLMIAECQIEGTPIDLAGARTNINLIRARAANATGFVKESDGITPAANYVIAEYPAGYPFNSPENARIALQMERKLELGQEGHRWFDLNRWGNTKTEINRMLVYEKTMQWGNNLYGAAAAGDNVNIFPIPQRQIDLSNGKLVPNR